MKLVEANRFLRDAVDLLEGGSYSLNTCGVPLAKARAYAEGVFKKAGKNLAKELSSFDKNYLAIQKKCKRALNVPRIQMPVIEPKDMKTFDARLKKGRIDVFKPYARGKLHMPSNITPKEGEEWVELGVKDGDLKDDIVKARWTSIPVSKLIPTQSQIWLEKLVGNIARFGAPKAGSGVTGTTVIVSKEGYILDGHHRFGQIMLADPSVKIKALHIPLGIDLLLKLGRAYGGAIGNRPKA